jgi:peptidoglycan DL-endopeptidase CwlO
MGLADTPEGHQMGTARAQLGRDDGHDRRTLGAAVRPALRALVPALVSGVLVLGVVPSASADRTDRPFPTRDEVAAAQERVSETARSVGAIKASLLLANQRLEAAAVEAEMASEAYNGAMWRLRLARQELASAREQAAAARRTVARQRETIGALVAASYQQGGDLNALTAVVGADGPAAVMDQLATFQGASESLQADYDRFVAADALANAFEKRAEEVRSEAASLAEEAREARLQAAVAAEAAQAAASRIAAEKDRLIRELASAQNISVSLARQRQAALEEVARERAAERARAEAEEAARQQAAKEARDRAEARRGARAEARADRENRAQGTREGQTRSPRPPAQQGNQTSPNTPQPASPLPAPAPPLPKSPPGGSGGADRAIAFAKAQLGDPYVWGAAGPDAWDCSGLMLRAWAQAGVSLPHYSVAQYYAGSPISVGDLRPGDLVFWGTSNSPESIHHVAMYIGAGQIVHAPRTGRPVSIDSLYYWTPPSFFARV